MKLKFLPSCTQHPRTTSFRVKKDEGDEIYKTINSVYFDPDADSVETPDSWFSNSSESQSTRSSESLSDVEAVIRGAQQPGNERLFFEPSSCVLGGGGHVTVAVESEDPHVDFKRSMAEMVESLGVGDDLEGLKELLGCYLKVNEETNHGYIVSAFVDLVSGNIHHSISTNSFSSALDYLSSSASARLMDSSS